MNLASEAKIPERGQKNKWNLSLSKNREISLNKKKITDEQMLKILQISQKSPLKISLQQNKITFVGIKFLSNSKWLSLKYLNLKNNYINCMGGKYLSQINWKGLEHLNLGNPGIRHLVKGQYLKLKFLTLSKNIFVFGSVNQLFILNVQKLSHLKLSFLYQSEAFFEIMNLALFGNSLISYINVQSRVRYSQLSSLSVFLQQKFPQLTYFNARRFNDSIDF